MELLDSIELSDFQNICRFCLSELDDNAVQLFDQNGQTVNPTLLAIISNCIDPEVSFSDVSTQNTNRFQYKFCYILQINRHSGGLPQHLCTYCASKINEFNEFRINCISSVDFLETALRENNKISNETVVVELEIEQENENSVDEQSRSIFLILNEDGDLIEKKLYNSKPESIFENIDKVQADDKINQDLDHDYCADETSSTAHGPSKNKLQPIGIIKSELDPTIVPENPEQEQETPIEKGCKTARKEVQTLSDGKDLCNICGVLHSHTNMRRHIEMHLGPNRKHPYTCPKCDKKFINRLSFVAHVNRHNDVRPYKCYLCEKAFHGANLLRTHMNSHSAENKYACSECDKVFRYPHYLSQHRRIHKANTLYSCNFCDYTNVYLHNYKNHMRKHTGDYKFKCEVCDKGFTKKLSLERHLEKHQQ